MAAPSAAPLAVPSTYGSASGLRSRPWYVAPGERQRHAHGHRRQDARQAQLEDDRLGRLGPGDRRRASRTGGGPGSRSCRRWAPRRCPAPRPRRAWHASRAEADERRARPGAGGHAPAVRGGPRSAGAVRRAWCSTRRGERLRRCAGWSAGGAIVGVGMDGQRQRGQALADARPGPGHDRVVDRPDGAVLDGRDLLPAGPLRHESGQAPYAASPRTITSGSSADELLERDLRNAPDRWS